MSAGSADASGERAVAAGRDIGNVSTGDFVTQIERATVLPAEALMVTGRVCHLPERSEQFVGRGRELSLLDEAFAATGGVVVHAVHGLGGIGKSTLAARWAAGRIAEYNPVWWITAGSPSELDAGLAALGRALQPALVGILTDEALRERTLQWLSSHDGWLLVLDNVSDPADIGPLLARAPDGRFLITTRLGAVAWRGMAKPLDLDVLEIGQAVELFTRVCDGSADGVEELCDELGCLPLAVDQAAAYCREAGIAPRAYLELLARYPTDMYAATAEGGDAQRTVARVWRVTLERLSDTPLSVAILRIIAYWAPDGIPRAYLEGIANPLQLTEAIRRLAAHSMITLREDTISVHRLVQAVARTLDPDGNPRAREAAVRILNARWPQGPLWGDDQRAWAKHVEALASCTVAESDTEASAQLFVLAGGYFASTDLRRGITLCTHGISVAERASGPDSSEAVLARVLLASMYMYKGDFERACHLLEGQFADCMRRFGAEHPDTLRVGSHLAAALNAVGRAEEGRALARETAEHAARAYGRDSAVAVDARVQLSLMDINSDLQTLESQLSEAFPVLGDDNVTVKRLELRRVRALMEAGDSERALALAEPLVSWYRNTVGDGDKEALVARLTHVLLLLRTDEQARASEVLAEIIADYRRVPGGDHDPEIARLTTLLETLEA